MQVMDYFIVTWISADNGRKRTKTYQRLGDARRKVRALQRGKPASRLRKAQSPVPAADIEIRPVKLGKPLPLEEPKPVRRRAPKGRPGIPPDYVAMLIAEGWQSGERIPNSRQLKAEFPNLTAVDLQEALLWIRRTNDDRFYPEDPRNPRSPLRRR